MNVRVTFANRPEKNGESLYFPASLAGLLQTIRELIEVALRRKTPVTITIEFR